MNVAFCICIDWSMREKNGQDFFIHLGVDLVKNAV